MSTSPLTKLAIARIAQCGEPLRVPVRQVIPLESSFSPSEPIPGIIHREVRCRFRLDAHPEEYHEVWSPEDNGKTIRWPRRA